MRVLFVNDESAAFEQIEKDFKRLSKQWEMTFARGGSAALAYLGNEPFDVIVTDMRMVGLDGASLLRHVRMAHPHMIRLAIAGEPGANALLVALPEAHQVLSSPCDARDLELRIKRAKALQACLDNPVVRERVSGLSGLPILPRLHIDLTLLLESPHASAASVGQLIERDVSALARLLQFVNSAFLGLARTMETADEAVAYLGFSAVRSLVLMTGLYDSSHRIQVAPEFSFERLQSHAMHVAQLAVQLVDDREEARTAFSAALLHDVGCLVLASALPEQYSRICAHATEQGISFRAAELALGDFTHAELGAYFLGLWGLPYGIVEAVAHHHDPMRAEETQLGAVGAVHVANALAHGLSDAGSLDRIDAKYVSKLKLKRQQRHWLELAGRS